MTQQQWFVVRAGKEEGPFSGQRLKEMAADGRLRPDDLVRRGDVESARPARAIKGLFPVEGAENSARASTASTNRSSPASQRPLPGGGASEKEQGGSKRRWVIPSVVAGAIMLTCCGGFGVIGYFGIKMKDATQREVAEADALWDRGEKALAVDKYRGRLGANSTFLKAEDKPRVYGRVVDYDVERGDMASATTILAEAVKNKVAPQVSHPEAKALVAAEEARKATEQAHARGEVLTADFFPFKRGSSYRSTRVGFADYKDGEGKTVRAERRSTYEYTHEPDGAIVSRQLDHYMTPGHVTLPPLGPTRQMYRDKDGHIEIGDTPDPKLLEDAPALKQNEDFMRTKWHPVVKVGALVGDEWERVFGPKDEPGLIIERYKLVKIAPQEVEFKGGGKEKVTVAFVETRVTAKLGGGKTMETGMDLQLARGIGLVHQSSWGIEQGKRLNYWYEHFTPSK